jgi:hypothetical protein
MPVNSARPPMIPRPSAALTSRPCSEPNSPAVSGKGRGPFAVGGQDVFDGYGNVRGVITSSMKGKITRFIHSTGKYTVNPDCTGSVSFSGGTTGDLFIAPDGSQYVLVHTNPGTVAAELDQRVTARRAGD